MKKVEEKTEKKTKAVKDEPVKDAKKGKKEEPAKASAKAKKEEPAKVEESTAVVPGKFTVFCNSAGGYRFALTANNGQLLYESRDYKTLDGCVDNIEKFKHAVATEEFKIKADKFGNYKYFLKSPTSHTLLYIGESFTEKATCVKNIESVKRFAPISPVVDATKDDDYTVKFIEYSIPEEIRNDVKAGKGAVGRWEIVRSDEDDKESPFVFLLYANNGQLMYESREYSTAGNCKKGLENFVKSLEGGNFVIDADKFGRYKFILRTDKSQMEYIGQFYSDKASCIASAVSVYKFALRTPLEK